MSFSDEMARFADETIEETESIMRNVMVLFGQGLVQTTPVDTGRARANWMFGYNSADISTVDDTDKNGSKTIGRIMKQVNLSALGGALYLTNSLPYANRLENGWSKQAPAGMVAITIRNFDSILSEAVRLARIR